jgi:hypothetical protein
MPVPTQWVRALRAEFDVLVTGFPPVVTQVVEQFDGVVVLHLVLVLADLA